MFKAHVGVFAIQQRVRVDDLVEGQHFRLTRTLQICVQQKTVSVSTHRKLVKTNFFLVSDRAIKSFFQPTTNFPTKQRSPKAVGANPTSGQSWDSIKI